MAAIEHQLKAYNYTFETILQRLREAIDLIEDCGATYRAADDYIKRMMNLAIFKRILVDNDGSVTAELTEPFRSMIEPVKQQIKQYNYKIRGYNVPTDFVRLITKNYHIFLDNCWSKDFLVEQRRLELLTSAMRMLRSTR